MTMRGNITGAMVYVADGWLMQVCSSHGFVWYVLWANGSKFASGRLERPGCSVECLKDLVSDALRISAGQKGRIINAE